MECPFCGFENENDESVCNSCGKTMDFPLNNSNIENSQPKVDKNRTSIDNNNQPNNKVDVHYYPNNNEYNNQNQYQNNQGYNNQNPNNYPNNQGYNNQYNRPYNTKSKGIGLLLGFLITGAGLCYVDKWACLLYTSTKRAFFTKRVIYFIVNYLTSTWFRFLNINL